MEFWTGFGHPLHLMAPPTDHRAPFRVWLLLGSGAVLALAALAWRRPPTGSDHAPLFQFLGRFHPLVIHLPIALILLVPVLELAGAALPQAHLRTTAGFVLGLAALTALGAAFDGWLLAWSGGYRGALVTRHMWGGIALAGLCLGTAWIRGGSTQRHPQGRWSGRSYAVILVALLGLLTWTSDQGGKLSHGDNFLTQYMPRRFKRWLGIAPPPAPPAPPSAPGGPSTLYTARIQPIFDHSCVSCHGPEKVKGGLRLDTYARLMLGGEDGPAVEPWLPAKSELIRRITLSSDDDDFMPSNNKNVLTPAQVKLLQEWIAASASDREPLAALHP